VAFLGHLVYATNQDCNSDTLPYPLAPSPPSHEWVLRVRGKQLLQILPYSYATANKFLTIQVHIGTSMHFIILLYPVVLFKVRLYLLLLYNCL